MAANQVFHKNFGCGGGGQGAGQWQQIAQQIKFSTVEFLPERLVDRRDDGAVAKTKNIYNIFLHDSAFVYCYVFILLYLLLRLLLLLLLLTNYHWHYYYYYYLLYYYYYYCYHWLTTTDYYYYYYLLLLLLQLSTVAVLAQMWPWLFYMIIIFISFYFCT